MHTNQRCNRNFNITLHYLIIQIQIMQINDEDEYFKKQKKKKLLTLLKSINPISNGVASTVTVLAWPPKRSSFSNLIY